MNIVKGVADLLRRSAGGQAGESSLWSRADRLSAPSPKIRFGEVGEEAVLSTLWQRYDNTIDKIEKRKLLQVFLMHFIQTYKKWIPVHNGELLRDSSGYATSDNALGSEDVVIGCFSGHPSEVILIIVQEIARITALVTEHFSEPSMSLSFSAEALYVLNSLAIITRSAHNCKVFSYYGGVQKVTALMKASVVQLKTLTGALAVEDHLSRIDTEKIGLLQKILVYVVSAIFSFMDPNSVHSDVLEKTCYILTTENFSLKDLPSQIPSRALSEPVSDARVLWQQKAIVLVTEAGGVNWLVELLRVIRRLNLKELWAEWSLQYLTLSCLKSALYQNPRAQNHFRSIGGLEVLLDQLGLPSNGVLVSNKSILYDSGRGESNLFGIFQLQVLSLQVLRESIFGNVTNLQFLCENGRIQKFANSLCSPAFILQEFRKHGMTLNEHGSPDIAKLTADCSVDSIFPRNADSCDMKWMEYCTQLSIVLCSFLFSSGDINPSDVQAPVSHSSMPTSFSYWELSIKWVMKVLLAVFPCIKACSSENELPNHLRVLANNLQHYTLSAFRKFLVFAPKLLEVLREEGIWDFIFSENFFYFGPVSEEHSAILEARRSSCDLIPCSRNSLSEDLVKNSEIDILQMEAISFVEFAATMGGNANNMPECSILLDALEQSACNPDIANILVKSLLRILQLATEQTISSFNAVDAVGRVLKVACIQAHECRKKYRLNLKPEDETGHEFRNTVRPMDHQKHESSKSGRNWISCMMSSLELFTEYLSIADSGRKSILHNDGCIDCLFDLFWEKKLRRQVLNHILGLMKLPSSSAEDRAAMLRLCSKYLETFTSAKENEKDFVELAIDLLVGMKDILLLDQTFYQALFCEGECFLHIVSLLNGTVDEKVGEQLVLNVLQTLTFLLAGNDISKSAFKALVGAGYQTLQSLLLDYCKSGPSLGLLDALLDMLVDGNFESWDDAPVIKNEDVITLFLVVLQKSSDSLRHYGLDIFLKLLKDSITNRILCSRAGMLSYLLDWFFAEESDDILSKLVQLIQIIGGHSVSGKDIRKIFALLRSEKIGSSQKYCSLLLCSIQSMLKEKGPTAFFELSGHDSGIEIQTPVQWPCNKGFSFSCWIRVENFIETGLMGLFSFFTESGKGCSAMVGNDKLVFESVNQKRQSVSLPLNLIQKKWHFLCITHIIGRAFSGGSLLRCYLDGDLVSSEKCRYAKVTEVLTSCTIGTRVSASDDQDCTGANDSLPFLGQIGPIYMFNDALSPEQIKGIFILGPSYMYSFVGNEVLHNFDSSLPNGLLDARDGLSSKILFGLNAQASDGSTLFSVSSIPERMPDKNLFQATVLGGTRLCSRRILQEIIYCVGGVSVFFPLLTRLDSSEMISKQDDYMLIRPIMSDKLAAEVIELVASVLDDNLANQQQMLIVSGFSILGFLFQSIPPQQLNMDTLSSLKHLLNIVRSCGMSDLLVKEAISRIYLNPHIWVYVDYEVQRELFMFLIQHFEKDASHLTTICSLPRIIDIIRQFYWDKAELSLAFGIRPLLHPTTGQVIGERPSAKDVQKIRLLLLSLSEMSLKYKIEASDIKVLIAFFERSQDMICIEDVLQMVMRSLSQKPILASFLEQVNLLGGSYIFISLLEREMEPIRLLGLQFLGKLLVGTPSEKKGQKFFNLSVGRSKSLPENYRKGGNSSLQPIFSAMSDRLFKFPLSDNLCATLFDVLLGGASPKQVLQKHTLSEKYRSKKGSSGFSSHFSLPQILVLIFNFLSSCIDSSARGKVLKDLLDLLDSNPSNIEALMENSWHSWLATSVELYASNFYKIDSNAQDTTSIENEKILLRNVYSIVLSHYLFSVKGGWQQLEDTVNFLLLHSEREGHIHHDLLQNIFKDLIGSILDVSSEENIFVSQPCRDNSLYLLKLMDEMLVGEISDKLLFPNCIAHADFSSDPQQPESDIRCSFFEILSANDADQIPSSGAGWNCKPVMEDVAVLEEDWWKLYDNIWSLICEMHGKGPSKTSAKASSAAGPSFGQRARDLVESLNIPAAEMAAVVVSGGIGSALGGKATKSVDKAMLLRGEKCPRVIFRLLMLYLSRASLERASKCVQQFLSLLPSILSFDDEQIKNRLQLYIWSILAIKSQYGMQDGGSRFHVLSHLLLEMVSHGNSILSMSISGRDDPSDSSSLLTEEGAINNLIQKDRVLVAVSEEVKYLKASKIDRLRQMQELRARIDENSAADMSQRKVIEDEIRSSVSAILSSDDSQRAAYQLAYDEDQQTIAEKWIHLFRALVDERGPWCANDFASSSMIHWKHDKTEDTWRRRPKLKRNYHFDEKLCYPPDSTCKETGTLINDMHSGTKSLPEQMKHFLLKGVRGITDEGNSESYEDSTEMVDGKTTNLDKAVNNKYSGSVDNHKDQADVVQDKKSSSLTAEVETIEALLSIPCVLVTPKRKVAGHLAVMPTVLHFSGEFLVEGTGGSSVFKRFKNLSNSNTIDQLGESHEQKLQKGSENLDIDSEKNSNANSVDYEVLHQNKIKKIKRHRRWSIIKIKSVHWTRYLLQYTAIEIFFTDSVPPVFLNFATPKDAKNIGTLIVTSRNEASFTKGTSRDKTGVISFVDRRVAVEMAEAARESWRRREMSNFEYLMALNTLAGRSYNDLTQYPVFPWVLADYTSEKLDFNKSSTFRDLSKPVGSLDIKRFEVFEDRYRNFCDPDIPSFYYGSHYSSMGIVLFYLLRLEPFTALHRNLQGGKFDHADRLFQSIEGTYRNCMSNTSDVKELIPEFFYMPEFLTNLNSYHLGVKQDGEPLGDVFLPPWAKGSSEEFIYRNKEALESEFVSSNLHHWIDLVFGYKQRGKPAVEAANVFYYLTYEGAVDLESMDDELQRSAIEDQIANFGQTPIQIFRKKHPRRGPPIPIAHPLYFAPASITLTSIVSNTALPNSSVSFIGLLDSNIVIVNEGLSLTVKTWLTTQLQSGGNFTFSSSQDPFFGIGSDMLPSRKIGTPLAENIELGRQCFTTLQTASENYLISCGSWDNSFQVISLNDGRMVQSIRQHKDVVSCVAVTSDGSLLATGSYDTTVMIWDVSQLRGMEKRIRNLQTEVLYKDRVIVENPLHILCGHDDIITCLFVSMELDIVVSGSKDGTCNFHTLREGRYIRSIRHPSGSSLANLVASQHGHVVIYAENDLSLHMFSINGKHLAFSESNGRLNCIELSCCGEFLVCGCENGQIILRSMQSLEVVRRYDGIGKAITSLTVTPEECFLAGTKDGNLLVYSIENPQLRKASLPRNTKLKTSATG